MTFVAIKMGRRNIIIATLRAGRKFMLFRGQDTSIPFADWNGILWFDEEFYSGLVENQTPPGFNPGDPVK
jgi:hypothetical protein